jgi:hypothetical protein
MIFRTEAERLQHPQAGLIPKNYWQDENLFNNQLPEELLPLMQAADDTAFRQALGQIIWPTEAPKRTKAFLCALVMITVSRPTISAQGLYALISQLKLNQVEQLMAAFTLGRLDLLNLISRSYKQTKQFSKLLKENSFQLGLLAVRYGYLDALRFVENSDPELLMTIREVPTPANATDQILKSIQLLVGYSKMTALYGHLNILQHLETKIAHPLIISELNREVFQAAAAGGHFPILEYLEKKAPEQLYDMIEAALGTVIENGRLDVLHYLENKDRRRFQEKIAASAPVYFEIAVEAGHLEVLLYLESKAAGNLLAMITHNRFSLFQRSVQKGHSDITNHLLSFTDVFKYAELHIEEYGPHVMAYITNQLQALRIQKQTQEQAQANAVFDVTSEQQATHLFYVLRHLIRLNDPTLRDDLLFLLEIPSIKRLAHQAITSEQSNELIRLALSLDNQTAAELLLAIPAVRELAAANDYYRAEQRGALDLRALADDRESSMTALSQGEQRRLRAVIDQYQPLLQESGVTQCMDDLRQTLIGFYEALPATITIDNQDGSTSTLTLPATWGAFQGLALTAEQRQDALKAYYQNPHHTAWRYLSKPNFWMHEQASYVYVDEHNHHHKWSTFEEYQSLISLLYLAAIDEETVPIDGYTLKTRLEHFIEELALIGRAHNWDDTRVKIDAGGQPVLDKDGNPVFEEYDNRKGDKPSCFSGVKRRLFQAVQGHPLLVFLTREHVIQEINDFVRAQFQNAVTKDNSYALKTAWDKCMVGETLSTEDWMVLKQLDIPEAQQQQFIDCLSRKYQEQWKEDPQFLRLVQQAFTFKKTPDAHALNFGHAHPEQFFATPTAPQARSLGLFAQGNEEGTESNPMVKEGIRKSRP